MHTGSDRKNRSELQPVRCMHRNSAREKAHKGEMIPVFSVGVLPMLEAGFHQRGPGIQVTPILLPHLT